MCRLSHQNGLCLFTAAVASASASAAASRRTSSNAAGDPAVMLTPVPSDFNTLAASAAAFAGSDNTFSKPKSSMPALYARPHVTATETATEKQHNHTLKHSTIVVQKRVSTYEYTFRGCYNQRSCHFMTRLRRKTFQPSPCGSIFRWVVGHALHVAHMQICICICVCFGFRYVPSLKFSNRIEVYGAPVLPG